MNLRLLIACILSAMFLFCVSAEAYQHTDDMRFAVDSSAVVDSGDGEIDSDPHAPALIESLFEVSLPTAFATSTFADLIPTFKPTFDVTSLNSRAPPLS